MTNENEKLCLQPLANERKKAFRQWLYSEVEERISKGWYTNETKFEIYKDLVLGAYEFSANWAKEYDDIPVEKDFIECFMDLGKGIPIYYAAWFARYMTEDFDDAVNYEKLHPDTANEIESELRELAERKRKQEEYHRQAVEDARKSGKYDILFKAIENEHVGGSDCDTVTILALLDERFPNNSQINFYCAFCFALGRAQGVHNERIRRRNKYANCNHIAATGF